MHRLTIAVLIAVAALEVGLGFLGNWRHDTIMAVPAWALAWAIAIGAAIILGGLTKAWWPSMVCALVATTAFSLGIYMVYETGLRDYGWTIGDKHSEPIINTTPFGAFIISSIFYAIPALLMAPLLAAIGSKVLWRRQGPGTKNLGPVAPRPNLR